MELKFWFCLIIVPITCTLTLNKRAISFFNIIKFPNDICISSNNIRNGTCYTEAECNERDGKRMGSCAEGYGVCCVIELGCGKTSSDNCTYLVQESSSTPTSPCYYKICSANTAICRIRFDFIKFESVPPQAQVSGDPRTGGAVGDCTTDAFSVSTAYLGSPNICGINTGQHIFVDANHDQCNKVVLTFGPSSTTRSYTIKSLQFTCDDEMGGPPGCLQYHSELKGTIASFNYKIGQTTISTSGVDQPVHLKSHHYSVCFRRASGYCSICFTPSIVTTASPSSFGLSNSVAPSANLPATHDTNCNRDYISIPGGMTTSTLASSSTVTKGIERICGRTFSASTDATASKLANAYAANGLNSICSGRTPFQIGVHFSDNEEIPITGTMDATTDESSGTPLGIIGFSLNFNQIQC